MSEEKKSWQERIGEFVASIGEMVFWLSWWCPLGIELGGTPTVFGGFRPELEIVLPISAFGLLLWWLGRLFSSTKLDPHKIIFPLLWLVAWGVGAIFSLDPTTSIKFLLIWMVGLLALGTGETFFASGIRRLFFTIGLGAGFAATYLFPEIGVSTELLSLGAVWGLMFLAWEPKFYGKFLWQLAYLFAVFQTHNLGILLAALALLMFGRRWFGVRSGRQSPYWIAVASWGAMFGWQLAEQGPFLLRIQPFWREIFTEWQQLFFGIGDGQFLVALQRYSTNILGTADLRLPDSGAILTFFEHGIIGLILILALLLLSNAKRPNFMSWWLVYFWIFAPSFIAREEGIILMLVLLATQVPKERPEEKKRQRRPRKRLA